MPRGQRIWYALGDESSPGCSGWRSSSPKTELPPLPPAVDRYPLNADLDAELPVGVCGVATLIPGSEVEDSAVVVEDAHVHHALPDRLLGEDDQIAFGEVLYHLEVVELQVEPVTEGVAEVVRLRVVTAAIEPANCCPTDELVPATANVARGRDGAVDARRLGPWVSRVPRRRHSTSPTDHLREGAVVTREVVDVGVESLHRGGMPTVPFMLSFEQLATLGILSPMSRTVAFPAPKRGAPAVGKMIW